MDRDRERLATIMQMIGDIERRLAGWTFEQFVDDGDERDLTAYRLAVIGENANKLSDAVKARHPDVPWRGMAGLRNVVSHEYRAVVPSFRWNAVEGLEPIRAMCAAERGSGS
jgi:uncharacterized protein with HEPN domain